MNFNDLKISDEVKRGLVDLGFSKMLDDFIPISRGDIDVLYEKSLILLFIHGQLICVFSQKRAGEGF